MTRSGPGFDALSKMGTDGQIVADGILPAVIIGLEIWKAFPNAKKKKKVCYMKEKTGFIAIATDGGQCFFVSACACVPSHLLYAVDHLI